MSQFASYSGYIGGGGAGSGVSSLNSETGAINIVAGSGITVTPAGQNITIASTSSGGSVTSVSVVSANGLAGTVANPTTTPAITLSTSITGVLKGDGTAISAAVSGTDYVIPSGSITGTATNITASSNSTLTTLSALSLPGAQVTGNISGNAANITGSSNSTLTTLSALSLPGAQVTGNISGNAGNITASTNNTLTTLSSLSLPTTQLTGTLAAAQEPAHTGDVTNSAGSLALTLATVNSNVGSFGSSTSIPSFTVNAKGLITAAAGNAVVAPAGTLSGTTLNATVVSSSLTSVGTISSGTWNGSTIDTAHGGTGLTMPGTSGNVLTSNGSIWQSVSSANTNPFQFFASSQVTTVSTAITGTSFSTFSNSPAFSVTPTVTGTYKVYSGVCITQTGAGIVGTIRIFNTSGAATLLNESQGAIFTNTVSQEEGTVFIQSVYTLTASTTYVFDIQGKNSSAGSLQTDGGSAPFYMFCERCG